MPFRSRYAAGFTLIELLFVLLIVALLASLVAPVVTSSIGRAKESTLREDLKVMRKAIDDHYADTGKYPAELEDLVKKRYLRKVPIDAARPRAPGRAAPTSALSLSSRNAERADPPAIFRTGHPRIVLR